MARHHEKDINLDQVSNYTLYIDHPGVLFGKIWLIYFINEKILKMVTISLFYLYVCCGSLINLTYQDAYSSTEEQNPPVHPSYMQPLMQLLASLDTNTTVDLARPHFRKIFRSDE